MGPESNHRGGGYGPCGGDLWGDQNDGFDYQAWEREHMRRQKNVATVCVILVAAVITFAYIFFGPLK
jgi:hypothetical protein